MKNRWARAAIRPLQLVSLVLLSSAQALAGVEDGPLHRGHPDWMRPAFVDLESDLQRVRDESKTGSMVLFTTQGCTYCAEFVRASLGDPEIRRRVQDRFVAISLEIFDDTEMTDHLGNDLPIKEFAERHKAGMAPTLLFFGPDRTLIHRAIGYQSPQRFGRILDYLVGGHYKQTSFRDYLRQRESAPTAAGAAKAALPDDPLFSRPPYALARVPLAASEPMLVIFETAACDACRAFREDVLALPEVRRLLKQFEVVRLDAHDDKSPLIAPDGRPTTPAQWYAQEDFSRLPALLYVSETGQTAFKTDALVERQRMLNATGLVLDRAYEKGWSYQRYARNKAIERNRQAASQTED